MTKHIHGQVNRPVVVGSGEPPDYQVSIIGDSDVPGSKKKVHLQVPIEHLPDLIDHLCRFLKYVPKEQADA